MLLQAAASVKAYGVVDWALSNAGKLRLAIGTDTIPNMMRKLAAAGADETELERLYGLEKSIRGTNTSLGMSVTCTLVSIAPLLLPSSAGSGFNELSKAYKKAGDVQALKDLLAAAERDGINLKPGLLEDLHAWILKRSGE